MGLKTSVTEVARNFAEYVNRVAFGGESFVLVRGKKPVAELRPVPAGRRLGELSGVLNSLPGLSEEEAASFGEELDVARRELEGVPLRDPWAS
ncbi:MAG: type II toxin-antitoxin system Phd/YefM family antitoxin [Rubrobacteraceae bacterium]